MSPFLETLYRLALKSFPADFRRRFSRSMMETYRNFYSEAGVSGALRAIGEAVLQGFGERFVRMSGKRVSNGPAAPFHAHGFGRSSGVLGVNLGGVSRDAKYALRAFRRSPTFTVTALAILSIGIGASTSVFSVLDALIFRSLPFPEPERLVTITETFQPEGGPVEARAVSYPDFLDWKANTTAFSTMGIRDVQNVALRWDAEEPTLATAAFVSPAFFRMLGVTPAVGRTLDDADDVRGNLVAVVGFDLWVTQWGMDSSIVGSVVTINDRSVTVVGVARSGFDGTFGGVTVWLPFLTEGELIQGRGYERVQRRGLRGFSVFARLTDDATLSEAQRQIDVVTSDLHASGVLPIERGALVESFEEVSLGTARNLVGILAAAVALVLLIACANVANLLLARQLGRTREMALRRAIGADKVVLMRQLLVESLVLGGLGGVAGAALAVWLTGVISSTIVSTVPSYIVPGVDATALGFAVVLSLATGIVFGMVPALNVGRDSLSETLKTAQRSDAAGGSGGLSTRRGLVIGQVAVAIPLLVGSALMIRSLSNTLAIETGFDPTGVTVVQVNLPVSRYDGDSRIRFARQIEQSLQGRSGISSVAIASDVPLSGGYTASNVELSDARYAGQSYRVYIHLISPGYFNTLGIPVLEGRSVERTDMREAGPVVVISEQMAQRFWPGQSALGRMVDGAVVVGVVANASFRSLIPNEEQYPDDPDIFLPISQVPSARLRILARGSPPAAELAEIIRTEVQALDGTLPVFGATTLEALVDNQVAARRAATEQLGAFALIAMLLAVGGLFGVMAYTVGRQAGEIGLRMALGATSGRIMKRLLVQAGTLVGFGVVVGIGLSIVALRFLESQLFGVGTADVRAYLTAGGVFLVVGLVACAVPAIRATRIDPLAALRTD